MNLVDELIHENLHFTSMVIWHSEGSCKSLPSQEAIVCALAEAEKWGDTITSHIYEETSEEKNQETACKRNQETGEVAMWAMDGDMLIQEWDSGQTLIGLL